MSSALPLDLDLSDLEAARDEAGETILELVEIALETSGQLQYELKQTILRLGSVRGAIIRAIDACAGEAKEGSEGDG